MKLTKNLTIVNLVLSCLFWLLGVLFFIFNVTRCWELWQGVGFLGIYCLPVPVISGLLALAFSIKQKSKKLLATNAATLAITVSVTLFSYFVSAQY